MGIKPTPVLIQKYLVAQLELVEVIPKLSIGSEAVTHLDGVAAEKRPDDRPSDPGAMLPVDMFASSDRLLPAREIVDVQGSPESGFEPPHKVSL